MKRAVIAVCIILASVVAASSIKTWSSGETLQYSDLNANFSHIHGTMVGGHGARLVNSDVSTSAAIAHTKMATPSLLPKAIGYTSTTCTTGTCAMALSAGLGYTIAFTSTGVYTLTWSSARPNNVYMGVANSTLGTGGWCSVDSIGTTTCIIRCQNLSGVANSNFSFAIFDDDN